MPNTSSTSLVKVKVTQLVRLFVTPWAVARQACLSMKFSKQEYWSGLSFPSPGIFLVQGSNPGVLHCRQILYHLSHQGSPSTSLFWIKRQLISRNSNREMKRVKIKVVPWTPILLPKDTASCGSIKEANKTNLISTWAHAEISPFNTKSFKHFFKVHTFLQEVNKYVGIC